MVFIPALSGSSTASNAAYTTSCSFEKAVCTSSCSPQQHTASKIASARTRKNAWEDSSQSTVDAMRQGAISSNMNIAGHRSSQSTAQLGIHREKVKHFSKGQQSSEMQQQHTHTPVTALTNSLSAVNVLF